jgi:hypothetical protein
MIDFFEIAWTTDAQFSFDFLRPGSWYVVQAGLKLISSFFPGVGLQVCTTKPVSSFVFNGSCLG